MNKLFLLFFLFLSHILCAVDVILLFGPPGCGKGTFSQFAMQHGYGHLSSGDLIRHEIKRDTPLSALLEETLRRGDFIDISLMLQLISNSAEPFIATDQPFIIDGFGRLPKDMAALRDYLLEIKANVRILFLDASDATCHARIASRLICPHCDGIFTTHSGHQLDDLCPQCQEGHLQLRLADSPEVTSKRLAHYRAGTEERYRPLTETFPTTTFNTDNDLPTCQAFYALFLDS